MASASTSGERTIEVLVDEQPEYVTVRTRSLDGPGKRVEIRCRDRKWVYIVDSDHVARSETAEADQRCPDWLDQVLRELGALDVVVEG